MKSFEKYYHTFLLPDVESLNKLTNVIKNETKVTFDQIQSSGYKKRQLGQRLLSTYPVHSEDFIIESFVEGVIVFEKETRHVFHAKKFN